MDHVQAGYSSAAGRPPNVWESIIGLSFQIDAGVHC